MSATEGPATAAEQIIHLTINGVLRSGIAEPRMLLHDFIRHELELTGTHAGCEHGVCGACTVRLDGEIVRSCIMLAVQADGAEVDTIEGVAQNGGLHPVQEAFREEHGLQCGFCTPGMVMATIGLLKENPDPSEEEVRDYLSGNICRCTGYVGIVAAVRSAAKKLSVVQVNGGA
jgi:carbon-monoxide dehydrogenase small subunit